MDLTLKGQGPQDGNLLLGVTIDGHDLNVQSPQGDITPTWAPSSAEPSTSSSRRWAREIDVSGAAVFQVDMGQSGHKGS